MGGEAMSTAGHDILRHLRTLDPSRNDDKRYNARRMFLPSERYVIDFDDELRNVWFQFDTDRDAPYFGVWTSEIEWATLTYCEGDWALLEFDTVEAFRAELEMMREYYGPAPGECRVIDSNGNLREMTLREALGGGKEGDE